MRKLLKAKNIVSLSKALSKKAKMEGENIFSPEYSNKVKNLLERKIGITRLNSYPLDITLGITEKCNASCIFCDRTDNKNYSNMDYERFKKIADEVVPYARLVNFTGWGENLIHPDYKKLFDYLVEHKNANTRLSIITNGSVMTEWHIRKFMDNVDNLVISLNSCKEETYNSIMFPLKFDKVVNNIKRFAKTKLEMGKETPRFRASLIAMKQNIEELPTYVQFAKDLGFTDVGVTYLIISSLKTFDHSLYFHQELANEMILKAKKIAEDIGIRFTAPPLFGADKSMDESASIGNKCYSPWTETVITSDGRVVPCCFWDGTDAGRLTESSFSEIWNGERYRKIRTTINGPKAPRPCALCRLRKPASVDDIGYHLQRAFEKTKECQGRLARRGC